MFEYVIIIAAQIAVLAAVVILREPKLLIPAVVFGLPMEYLETATIQSLGSSGISGAIRSLLNPGQAAMTATVIVGVVRLRRTPSRLMPDSAIILPILLLVAIDFLGVAWSDSLVPTNRVLMLPLYVAFVFVAPSFIEDRRDIERIVGAFLIAAIVLAVLAVLQRVMGVFNWREILIQSDNFSYRSNATFADPNNLARFLAVAMSLGGGLILVNGPRRQTLYLAIPALAVGGIGIVATASRSGWLMLVFCSFLVVVMAPIARYTKIRLTAASMTAVAVLLGLLLAQGGNDAERVKSMSSAVSVIGQRSFLVNAGWHMFKDNPIVGVGSGNFQHSLVTTYMDLVPSWAKTTLSHTSLISLIAELGVVGIAMLLFLMTRLTTTLVRLYRSTDLPYIRLIVGWLASSLVGFLLASQSEGRLFDEPYLWVLFALTIAVETSPSLCGRLANPASPAVGLTSKQRGSARNLRTHAGAVAIPTTGNEASSR